MDKENFIKILPALIAALFILGAVLGYGFYKKWQAGEERPSYIPAPTNIPPLAPDIKPEPTNVAPLRPADIPKPTNIPPLGSEVKNEELPPEPVVPPPTGVKPL